ncbi:MAG: prepilin-type N-terminal cleavage/methylation domain-containing protein [candidate division Zixibacteria bacterium]|nr:prepilin-type N-terminal cleavage/methylation domain-containing protein [candidate division Zixibacteria bacterium]
MKTTRYNKGYTIVEMLIALLITGLIASAGFEFYISVHNQTMAQEDISDMQQNSRASLYEIGRTLRMAGYKVGTHAPYEILDDTLRVFMRGTQPVDTVTYFLARDTRTSMVEGEESQPVYRLMKKTNSLDAQAFTDMIESVSYTVVNPTTIEVSLRVRATRSDEDFTSNDGYREFTATERVKLRNLGI